MTLKGAIFTDDEDRAKSYRVVDVKYSSEYDVVCCFCIPYSEAAKNANEDDLVFDCDYVKKNCNCTGYRFHVEESEGDGNEGDADDDYEWYIVFIVIIMVVVINVLYFILQDNVNE